MKERDTKTETPSSSVQSSPWKSLVSNLDHTYFQDVLIYLQVKDYMDTRPKVVAASVTSPVAQKCCEVVREVVVYRDN